MSANARWSRVAKYIFAGLLAAWAAIIAWASGHTEPKPWYVLAILSFKLSAPIVAALVIIGLDIYQEVKYQSSKAVLKKFLDYLHRKYFPHPTGGLAPLCRVTLLTPGSIRRRTLGVKARSGGLHMTSRVRWNIKRSEEEKFHGVAGYSWALGIFVGIDGLPEYDTCSPAEKLKYLRETFIAEKEASKLHWRARSFRSLAVKNQRGEKIGVLMMESKLPQGLTQITAETFSGEAEYLQFLLAQTE
jgi:hypothetical protein